jgi:hypothetical protein
VSNLINDDVAKFLSLPRLPGRLNLQQTAALLGIADHDVATLVRAGLLKPLGKPEPKAPKFFAAVVVESMARDPDAMEKAVRAISRGWQRKNERQRNQLKLRDTESGKTDQGLSPAP